MNDLLGNELKKDDYVIFSVSGYNHSIKTMVGKVLKFTEKMVKIRQVQLSDIEFVQKKKTSESNRSPTTLIKIHVEEPLSEKMKKIKEILQ